MIAVFKMCGTTYTDKVRPIFNDSRIDFIKLCYNSVLRNVGEEITQMFFVVDNANTDLFNLIKDKLIMDGKIYKNLTFLENQNITKLEAVGVTAREALDVAAGFPKEKILLVEDDYYFLPGVGKKMVRALDEFEVITPYDHPAYYKENLLVNSEKKEVDGTIWQSVPSTCLTFACRGEFLNRELEVFKDYACRDSEMWQDIGKRTKLWASVPTLATHMEKSWMAPGIDWEKEFKESLKYLKTPGF